MRNHIQHTAFRGRMVMLGFGSIGQGVLTLLLRHIDMTPEQMTIVTATEHGRQVARRCKVADFRVQPITRQNYREILTPLLNKGDFLVNLACNVSSPDLIELCRAQGALYMDADLWPWVDNDYVTEAQPEERFNYLMREKTLALRASAGGTDPTAVITHGVNPGLVSHFLKQALLNMAHETGRSVSVPETREGWAQLAHALNMKVVHVAERDSQVADRPKQPGEFVNTWSIHGLIGEGTDAAELGWGSHERHLPAIGRRHHVGSGCAIYLERPGVNVRVRSWTPLEGAYHGFLITHGEAITIPDYYTLKAGDELVYRPTCHYAYHPCDDAVLSVHEFCGKGFNLQRHLRILGAEVVTGMDELGVMIGGNAGGVYWYGSRLTIEAARELAPNNNATTLQTAAGVLGAVIWAIENPACGITEPDEMDYRRVLDIATPYLGEMVGVWGDWNPLKDRIPLFPEDLDESDPWQFKNIMVA